MRDLTGRLAATLSSAGTPRSRGSRKTRGGLLTALALLATTLAPLSTAQAREATRAELEERIRRLEEIIRQHGLDKPPAPAAPKAAAPKAAAPLEQTEVEAIVDEKLKKQKVLAGWKDGFYLESPNGEFKMKLRGYLQTDLRFFPLESGDTGTDSIFLRRVRPIIEGTVYKYFDFRIMPDFGEGTSTIQDAYSEVKYWPYARLRAGKFKVPLSLERLQSGSEIVFVERSIANNLTPNRDVGVQFAGDFFDGALGYQLAGFNGVPDGRTGDGDTTSDKELTGRIFGSPFLPTNITPLRGFGLGLGGTFGGQRNGDSLTSVAYKTAGRSTFFKWNAPSGTTVVADGDRARLAPQAYYYWGPFGAMGEYIFSQQDVRKTVTSSGSFMKGSFTNTGWFAQGSYVLTGEDASYKQVVPINNFDPRNDRWGAFELAVRGSMVDIDEDAFRLGFATRPESAQTAWNYGLGVNWYLNKNFKLMANWERTEFDEEVLFGSRERDHEDVILTRFQVSY